MENNNTISQAFQKYVAFVIESKNPVFDLSTFPFASQIGFNQIDSVFEQMPWLESVNLSNIDLGNQVTDTLSRDFLPNFLGYLRLLNSLTLNNCNLVGIFLTKEFTNLKNLNLRNNPSLYLLSIDKEISLELLDLSLDTQIIYSNSLKFEVSNRHFPDSLKTLIFSQNSNFLTFFNELKSTKKFQNLEHLEANGNQLKDISFLSFSILNKLTTLNLQNNEIEDISPIENLASLEELNLSNNKIQNIKPLNSLRNIISLNLDNNKIEDLTALAQLGDILRLQLSDNPIKDIKILSLLTNLTALHLNHCLLLTEQLTEIEKLIQLSELQMHNCGIDTITFINSLNKLKTLGLSHNNIVDISPLIRLAQTIKTDISIDLEDNKIREIEPFTAFEKLLDLNVKSNPIQDYPQERIEILTPTKLKTFFQEPRVKPNSHAKLILFGNSGVGKTNLNNVLIHNEFKKEQDSTDGIKIDIWKPKDKRNKTLRINVWDFGGQEYYHGTHRLFLTKNSVFSLLWNQKTNHFENIATNIFIDGEETNTKLDHFHYDYWLDNIAFYSQNAQNTEGSSVGNIFLVQNLFDADAKTKNPLLNTDAKGIKEVFAFNLKQTPNTKREEKKNALWFNVFKEELIDALSQNATEEMMTVNEAKIQHYFVELFDASITNNKALIDNKNPFAFAAKKNYLEWTELFNACKSIWETLTEKRLHRLLNFLQTKGVVTYLRYYKPDNTERRIVFFNQKWLLDNINAILNKNVREAKGVFNKTHLESIVNDLADDFIELMERYNIAVKLKNIDINNTDSYLAPQYLPNDNTLNVFFDFAVNNSNADTLTLRMPVFYYRNAMLRLIWLYGSELTPEQRSMLWKNGIFYTDPRTKANIFVHGSNFTGNNECDITIAVAQKDHKKVLEIQLLEDILGVFNPDYRLYRRVSVVISDKSTKEVYVHQRTSSNEDFKHIQAEQVSERVKLSVKKSPFITVDQILKQTKANMSFVIAEDNSRIPMKVFDSFLKTLNLTQPKPSVFISYSHNDKDVPLFNELKTQLETLKRFTDFEIWTDKNITTGSEWDADIQSNLLSSEVFVMLISADYFASNYIYNKEWSNIKERIEKKGVKIVPILLRRCPISPELNALQFAARDDLGRRKPIAEWEHRDQAWTDIAQSIKELLAL